MTSTYQIGDLVVYAIKIMGIDVVMVAKCRRPPLSLILESKSFSTLFLDRGIIGCPPLDIIEL